MLPKSPHHVMVRGIERPTLFRNYRDWADVPARLTRPRRAPSPPLPARFSRSPSTPWSAPGGGSSSRGWALTRRCSPRRRDTRWRKPGSSSGSGGDPIRRRRLQRSTSTSPSTSRRVQIPADCQNETRLPNVHRSASLSFQCQDSPCPGSRAGLEFPCRSTAGFPCVTLGCPSPHPIPSPRKPYRSREIAGPAKGGSGGCLGWRSFGERIILQIRNEFL